jgi:hypothetical protein
MSSKRLSGEQLWVGWWGCCGRLGSVLCGVCWVVGAKVMREKQAATMVRMMRMQMRKTGVMVQMQLQLKLQYLVGEGLVLAIGAGGSSKRQVRQLAAVAAAGATEPGQQRQRLPQLVMKSRA